MKKLAATLAMAAGTLVLINPSPAFAWPTGCSAKASHRLPTSPDIGTAKCTGGSGHVRVVVYCTANPKTGYGAYHYGPWARTPGSSGKECPSKQKYIVSAGYERANW